MEKLETVTLIAPHTHAGITKQSGDTLQVNAADKHWLAEHGRIASGKPTPETKGAARAEDDAK